jgi:hypothetical protein
MNIVRYTALTLFLAVMALLATGHRSWEALGAALVLMAVIFWACGAFRRDVWFATPELGAEYARIDAELDEDDRRHRARHPHSI